METYKTMIEACEAGDKEFYFCPSCMEVTAVLNPGLDIQFCVFCGKDDLWRMDKEFAEYTGDPELLEMFKEENQRRENRVVEGHGADPRHRRE